MIHFYNFINKCLSVVLMPPLDVSKILEGIIIQGLGTPGTRFFTSQGSSAFNHL